MAEDDSASQAAEEWKSDLARIIRRKSIYDQMQAGQTSFNEIKAAVRNYEEKMGVAGIINSLVENDSTINPRFVEVATDISNKIRAQSPEVAALVIPGSNATGGAELRTVTKTPDSSDFDWALLLKDAPEKRVQRLTSETIKVTLLEKPITNDSGEVLKPCERHSFTDDMDFVLANTNEATELLTDLSAPDIEIWRREALGRRIGFFLSPSFPPEVNKQNRELLVEGLESMSAKDHPAWQRTVERISSDWQSFHRIKEKHLNIATTKPKIREGISTDEQLRQKVVQNSGQVMSQVMIAALEATDKSGQNV